MTHRIWILTLFPEYFKPLLECGVVGQAIRGERGQSIELNILQLRDFCADDYKGVDASPYGGGPGMVMRADILKSALVEGVFKPMGRDLEQRENVKIIYTAPRGQLWNQEVCLDFSERMWGAESPQELVFICGRYEGLDERFIEKYVDEIFSLGDYVLSGGEIAVMAMLDSALRFMPGVLGNKRSATEDSFSEGLLEHPQYTRPALFQGLGVPDVLLSGHHKKIKAYQFEESLKLTKQCRPDLLAKHKREK